MNIQRNCVLCKLNQNCDMVMHICLINSLHSAWLLWDEPWLHTGRWSFTLGSKCEVWRLLIKHWVFTSIAQDGLVILKSRFNLYCFRPLRNLYFDHIKFFLSLYEFVLVHVFGLLLHPHSRLFHTTSSFMNGSLHRVCFSSPLYYDVSYRCCTLDYHG